MLRSEDFKHFSEDLVLCDGGGEPNLFIKQIKRLLVFVELNHLMCISAQQDSQTLISSSLTRLG